MSYLRIKCAHVLQHILEDKIFFAELKKQFSAEELPYANMLILTSLRQWVRVTAAIKMFLRKRIPHKHRIAEYLLKIAAIEILYMDTASYAVVNETVKCVRQEADKFLAGMVNAILRQIVNQKAEIIAKMRQITPLPDDFEKILQGYTSEQKQEMAAMVEVKPLLDISVADDPRLWQQKLHGLLLANGSIRLKNAEKVQQLVGYTEGQWWVQDAAASLAVQVIGNVTGKKVLDLCAAPGGKTAQLAAAGAEVTALDISVERLNILQQNMERLGFGKIKTAAVDAVQFLQTTSEKFDVVLLDAPCSATGTFRRHPEVLHIKTQDDVNKQIEIQKQILALCQNVLNIGGILVYSVCSLSRAEGEEQIADFMKENLHFQIMPITEQEISLYGKWRDNLINVDGAIRTLPYYEKISGGMDGFFICKMKRIN